MTKAKPALFLILLVIGLFFLQSFHLPVQGQAVVPLVRIDPPQTASLSIGDNFTLFVWVDNASHVEAAQVQFTFDPTVLKCDSVVEGPFLQSAGQTIVAQQNFTMLSDTLAEVQYAAAGISGNTASGSGILLNATFTVLNDAASQFHLLPYEASGTYPGTYFQDINNNIEMPVPNLRDGFYGSPVSLTTSEFAVEVGQPVSFSGKVGGSLVGTITSVEFDYKPLSGDFSSLANLSADSSGHFSYQWTPSENGIFEFRVSFDVAGKTTSSGTIEVVVQPALHGYGIYIYYAFLGLIVFIIALTIVLRVRTSRRHAAEKPPT
jgi:hypothetical protein